MRQCRVEDQIAVDFVGAENEVMPHAEFTQLHEFLAPEDARHGIMRIAEKKELGAGRDGTFQGGPVDFPALIVRIEGERHGDGCAPGIPRRAHERRINRGEAKHLVVRLRECLGGDVESYHQARQPDQPGRVDFPSIPCRQRIDDCVHGGFHRPGITVDAVFHPLMQCGDNCRRGAKIHVGDPEREHVAAGILLPFLRVGATAIGRSVEIESHGIEGKRSQPRIGNGSTDFFSI